MKIGTLKRDVIDGMRPGKGVLLALIAAAEQAGVEEIEELPIGHVRLIFESKISPEEAIDAHAAGLKWCSYHERFEPLSSFSRYAAAETRSRDCIDSQRERYAARKPR